jgi:hypothetical protein
MKYRTTGWIALPGVVILAAALWGPLMSNVEQPKYLIVESDRSIEIRDYPAMIVAEADVRGRARKPSMRAFASLPITFSATISLPKK